MDAQNYVVVTLAKPMGIVFEENDSDTGGIFVLELTAEGAAEADGTIRPGDQLVAVGTDGVAGLPFEDALGRIVADAAATTELRFFRGPAQFLHGPAGASREWLDEFVRGGTAAQSAAAGAVGGCGTEADNPASGEEDAVTVQGFVAVGEAVHINKYEIDFD